MLSIAQSREAWQLGGLDDVDRALLKLVDEAGAVRIDQVPGPSKALRESARRLERRLLVHGDELHTERGSHTKVLETWNTWMQEHSMRVAPLAVAAAQATLEAAVAAANSRYGAKALLPWQTKR